MEDEYLKLLEVLYDSMYEGLYQRTLSKYRDPAFAEEVVQEAFAIACAKPKQIFEHPYPEGWIATTVRYVADRKYRRRDNHLIPLDSVDLPDNRWLDDPAELLDPDILYADLAKTKEYKIIREMVDEHLSSADAAKQKGITEGAYKMRVFRSRKSLQKKLQKNKK